MGDHGVGLGTALNVSVGVYGDTVTTLPTNFGSTYRLRTGCGSFSLYYTSLSRSESFSMGRELRMDSNGTSVGRVVGLATGVRGYSAGCTSKGVRVSKSIYVSILCASPSKALYSLSRAVPMGRILRGVALPSKSYRNDFAMGSVSFAVNRGPSSTCQMVSVSVAINKDFGAIGTMGVSTVSSTFDAGRPISLVGGACSVRGVLSGDAAHVTRGRAMSIPRCLPRVCGILSLYNGTQLAKVSVRSNEVGVRNRVLSSVVCVSMSRRTPMSNFYRVDSFDRSVSVSYTSRDSVYRTGTRLSRVACDVGSSGDLRLEFVILLALAILGNSALRVVRSVGRYRSTTTSALPPMVVYFSGSNSAM